MKKQIAVSFTDRQLRNLNEMSQVLSQSRNALIREAVNNFIYYFYHHGRTKRTIDKKFISEGVNMEACQKFLKGECKIFSLRS